jgi:hypothetical protein
LTGKNNLVAHFEIIVNYDYKKILFHWPQVVRKEIAAWDKDRYMSPDISKVKNMLREEKVWNAVKLHLDSFQRAQVS